MFLVLNQGKNASVQKPLSVIFLKVIFQIMWFMIHSDENGTVLGNYAACSGNSLPIFWDKLSVPYSS